jgi:transcription elongation factor GreA
MEYMSQEGYDKIVEELRQLERVELPRVKDAIAEARDKGDLSENFEYHAAKREQGRLLSRIRFKQRVLEFARVIDKSKLGGDGVGLLSKVELTNMGNNTRPTCPRGRFPSSHLSPRPCSRNRWATSLR